ncbi:dienelactone hydrolase [Arcobacter venerupis]|uniref:Dienelactone hydrolase n=1 Tax=Arcobacter venerupis TaxID=1054033 RepID=A0AAE7E3H5_9BACT|nr:dienelactone hydrolase family protein [Arcobacter venerupis]QKF65666.1 dienelactone hydrolase [Arcobacter venerupis]RWS50178.1 dienelactone hydrolase [Arcobacter venerupis]
MKKFILTILSLVSISFANGNVTYNIDGKEYEGYYSPVSKTAPLIFMVHDWDGITEYEIKRTKMLNDLGYSVFAVDLYGKGIRPTELNDKIAQTKYLYSHRDEMRKRLNTGFEEAKKLGANVSNTLGMGYCFGGSAILEMARSGANMKAFVPFHGNLATPEGEDYKNTKGKIVVFHGSADTVVPFSEFASLAVELEKTGINHEMTTYSGAPHAFTVFGAKSYREDADKKSWKRFTEVLEETLK